MATRNYRLGRRGEAAEETRRRIVEATFALHNERGVVGTSMKQIAERAEVSVGTVYHHFPTYDDAINACGAHVRTLAPLPAEEQIANAGDRAGRIGKLVEAVFANYEQVPGYDRVRCERDQVQQIGAFIAADEAHRLTLIRAALGNTDVDDDKFAAISAVLDVGVYAALIRAGLTTRRAIAQIRQMILASLEDA